MELCASLMGRQTNDTLIVQSRTLLLGNWDNMDARNRLAND